MCNFVAVMKYLYLTLCLFACLSALAYNDHRNARIDSLEAALKSNHPPKGDDLLLAYDELMRGWLPLPTLPAQAQVAAVAIMTLSSLTKRLMPSRVS